MKKLWAVVFTLLLAGSLAFAQDTGGDKAARTGGTKPAEKEPANVTKTKGHKGGKKGHKGGKKSKKGSSTTTPPPK